MRSSLFVASIALALLAGAAQAQTLKATSNMLLRVTDRSLDFTSDTTTSIRDMKLVIAARDDAASFVASNGAIRRPRQCRPCPRISAKCSSGWSSAWYASRIPLPAG